MTDELGGVAIGRRVEKYRRMNGLTREQLSEATQGAVGKDVVTNLESGRRKDVTVAQLVALATALEVPPTALIYDLGQPMKPTLGPQVIVGTSKSGNDISRVRRPPTVSDVLSWYAGAFPWGAESEASPAAAAVREQLDAWRDYVAAASVLGHRLGKYPSIESAAAETDQAERLEIGAAISQAWRAYEHARSVGLQGFSKPSVSEQLADDFTPPMIEMTSEHFDRLRPIDETDQP